MQRGEGGEGWSEGRVRVRRVGLAGWAWLFG